METLNKKTEDVAPTSESQRLLSEMEALLERAREIIRRHGGKVPEAEPLDKPQADLKR